MKSIEHASFMALNLAASAIVLLDHAGNVVFMNLAAEQLFECTSRSLQGQAFWRSFVDGTPIEHLFWDGKAPDVRCQAF